MKIKAQACNIPQGVAYANEELKKLKIDDKKIAEALLSLEETLSISIAKSQENFDIEIIVERLFGNVKIKVQSIGQPIDKSELRDKLSFTDALTPEETIVVENLMDRVAGDKLHIKSHKGINKCHIDVKKRKQSPLAPVLIALVLGLLGGFCLKYTLPDFALEISENVFAPISTMFLNAFKMIVGPLVFVSIANSVMGFDDIKTLGKIAVKVFSLYIFTSIVAIGVGAGIFYLFPVGNTALQNAVSYATSEQIAASSPINISLKDIIINIIPTDIISPFMNLDMLQILFMGIVLGLAIDVVGRENVFAKLISSANDVFIQITNTILIFLPLSNFCAMAKLVINMDTSTLLKIAQWIPVSYLAFAVMITFYAFMLLTFARINPLSFFKKISKAMVTAFVTGSSNVTMPVTMDCCKNNLKISPKVYAFSIPFGATVNMDGCCITLIISTLFMAKSFGCVVSTNSLISLFISIMALSMGSPGVPGASLVSMTLLFPMVGVPSEAVSIIMGLYCLVNMPHSIVNVTGDMAVSTIVAKWENLIDLE